MSEPIRKGDDDSSGQNEKWPGVNTPKPGTTEKTGKSVDGADEKTVIPIVR